MKYTQLKNEKEFFKLAIASAFNRFGDSIDAPRSNMACLCIKW